MLAATAVRWENCAISALADTRAPLVFNGGGYYTPVGLQSTQSTFHKIYTRSLRLMWKRARWRGKGGVMQIRVQMFNGTSKHTHTSQQVAGAVFSRFDVACY